jgi:hypothetical protein
MTDDNIIQLSDRRAAADYEARWAEWHPKIAEWLAQHPTVIVDDADALAADEGTIDAEFIFDQANEDWDHDEDWTLGCENLAELFGRLFANIERYLLAHPDKVLRNEPAWIDANHVGDAMVSHPLIDKFAALFAEDRGRAEQALYFILRDAQHYYSRHPQYHAP